MALKDALLKHVGPNRGPQCTMCRLLLSLPKDDARDLSDALADHDTFTSAGIARALRDEGHACKEGSVSRHRRGECRA